MEKALSEKTLFTKIIEGEIPSEKLYEDEYCIVIRDINPQAPVHLLVIPVEPIPRLVDANSEQKKLLGHLLWVAGEVAREQGVDKAFRLVINNGADAGQTIFHLHLHILADKQFSEQSL